MNAAVDFDYEPPRCDEEVDDERLEHMLPPNANAELLPAKLRPEQRLAARRRSTHLARKVME